MVLFEIILMIFDFIIELGVTANNVLSEIHWFLPWVGGALIAITPFAPKAIKAISH